MLNQSYQFIIAKNMRANLGNGWSTVNGIHLENRGEGPFFRATAAQERGLQAAEAWMLTKRENYSMLLTSQKVLQPEGRAPVPILLV